MTWNRQATSDALRALLPLTPPVPLFGLVFGLIARAVVPGDDAMSLPQTWALGVGGSLLGGFLGAVIFGFDSEDGALQAGGIVGSIVGAVLLVIAVRLVRSRQSAA